MSPLAILKLYLATTAVFLAVDLLWVGMVANPFYQARLGSFLAPEVKWGAALLFYLLFVVGILVFAALPALATGSAAKAALLGALLGLVAYAAFDLTCLALFRDFPLAVAVVDLAWGTTVSAAVAAAAYGIGVRLGLG